MDAETIRLETIQLIIAWPLLVVMFFVLWAVLTKVIKRISEKKGQAKDAVQEEFTEKEISPERPS